jgi:hypothetical protein
MAIASGQNYLSHKKLHNAADSMPELKLRRSLARDCGNRNHHGGRRAELSEKREGKKLLQKAKTASGQFAP